MTGKATTSHSAVQAVVSTENTVWGLPSRLLLHGSVFFLLIPAGIAFWLAAIGMSPAPEIGFQNALLYIISQMLVAWWVNGLVAGLLSGVLKNSRLRLWQILFISFWVAWIPLTVFYFGHASFFAALYPVLAPDAAIKPFSWGYIWELLRYSLPFLPIWMAAVYGYRYATGINWFGQRLVSESLSEQTNHGESVAAGPPTMESDIAVTNVPAGDAPQIPAFVNRTRLPQQELPLAVKADEHYIHLWSDSDTDMVRYRFQDALAELDRSAGGQVHRSWWVRWDAISDSSRRGQSLSLTLVNGLQVPVSLSHKAEVLDIIQRQSAN